MFQDGLLFQVYEKCLLLRQMTTSGLFQKDSSEKLHMRVEPNEIMDESYMQILLRKAEGKNEKTTAPRLRASSRTALLTEPADA